MEVETWRSQPWFNVKWEIFPVCHFCFLSYLLIAYPGCIVLEDYEAHFSFQVTGVQTAAVEQIQKQFDGVL